LITPTIFVVMDRSSIITMVGSGPVEGHMEIQLRVVEGTWAIHLVTQSRAWTLREAPTRTKRKHEFLDTSEKLLSWEFAYL
jgi:hypothetical protein